MYSSSVVFFVSSSGDHRDLHSFPTRRSSDLNVGLDGRRDRHGGGVGAAAAERGDVAFRVHALKARHDRDLAVLHGADRKSTRLNSSHSQISYAVFCLKKKTSSSILPRRPACV